MVKENFWQMKRIFGLVLVVIFLSGISYSQLQEKLQLPEQASEKTKLKVEKMWEVKFEKEIENISPTEDGEKILISLDDGEKVILDKHGKVLKRQEGKRGRVLENGRFLTLDGEILGIDGNIIQKIQLGPFDIEYPIFSPSGKYFAIVPSYDADFPFIRVYNATTGRLLWNWQEGEPGKIIPKFWTAEFVDEEKIVIYEENLREGIIGLYEVDSGKEIWKTVLFEKQQGEWLPDLADYIPMSFAKNGLILFYHHRDSMLFSIDNNGEILWRKKCEGGKISPHGNYVFLHEDKSFSLIENKTERKIWSKIGIAAQVFFTPDERKVFLMAHLPDKDRVIKKEIRFKESSIIRFRDREETSLYILDVQNGNCLERRTDIDVLIQTLDNGFIAKQKNALLKFNIEE